MLSGLKFIPRDEIEKVKDGDLDRSKKEKKKSGSRRDSDRRKKRSRAHGSSSEDNLERIEKGSRKKKKWYSSNEDVSASSDESESDSENKPNHEKGRKQKSTKKKDDGGDTSQSNNIDDISRKEMGLEWMLRPKNNSEEIPETVSDNMPEKVHAVAEDVKKFDPRELNPYLKNEGTGYPEDMDEKSTGNPKLFSSSLVGDGGASWRLKALKRAQEQAAREGRKLNEVVEERWGSLGDLTVSLASRKAAAPTHAHLHAIKSRRSSWMQQKEEEDTSLEKSIDKAKMRVPKVPESLSWGKRRLSCIEDTSVVYAAMSSMNNFSNDGSFMRDFMRRKMDDDYRGLSDSSNTKVKKGMELETSNEDSARMKPPSLSANRLAAKVLQVLMKGKHEEVLKEVGNTKGKPDADAGDDESYRPRIDGSTSRCIMHNVPKNARRVRGGEGAPGAWAALGCFFFASPVSMK